MIMDFFKKKCRYSKKLSKIVFFEREKQNQQKIDKRH